MYDDKDFDTVTDVQVEEIPTKMLDDKLTEVIRLKARYDAAKETSSGYHKEFQQAQMDLITLMDRAGKSRWEVDGVGGYTKYDELKWRVPSDLQEKDKFLSFLASEKVSNLLGQTKKDIFLAYTSVHSATMNKLCNELKSLASEKGEDLEIPGVALPKAEPKLRSVAKRTNK